MRMLVTMLSVGETPGKDSLPGMPTVLPSLAFWKNPGRSTRLKSWLMSLWIIIIYLLVKTPRGNRQEFMRHFNISYTSYYNRVHKRSGHLYQGRYQAFLIDADHYLQEVSRYTQCLIFIDTFRGGRIWLRLWLLKMRCTKW